jgi:hypothetical protein
MREQKQSRSGRLRREKKCSAWTVEKEEGARPEWEGVGAANPDGKSVHVRLLLLAHANASKSQPADGATQYPHVVPTHDFCRRVAEAWAVQALSLWPLQGSCCSCCSPPSSLNGACRERVAAFIAVSGRVFVPTLYQYCRLPRVTHRLGARLHAEPGTLLLVPLLLLFESITSPESTSAALRALWRPRGGIWSVTRAEQDGVVYALHTGLVPCQLMPRLCEKRSRILAGKLASSLRWTDRPDRSLAGR